MTNEIAKLNALVQAALIEASKVSVAKNLNGLVRRYALDGKAYTASEFQQSPGLNKSQHMPYCDTNDHTCTYTQSSMVNSFLPDNLRTGVL